MTAPKRKLINNAVDAAGLVVLLLILLIFLGAGGYWALTSYSTSQLKEQLQPTLKSMMAVSVAASSGSTTRNEFREKVLAAKTEFSALRTDKIKQALPEATDEIKKALLCWEGAEFVWGTEGQIGYGVGSGSPEDYNRLINYMKEGLGDETFNKIEAALEKDGKILGDILLNRQLAGQTIKAFIELGDVYFQNAKRLLE